MLPNDTNVEEGIVTEDEVGFKGTVPTSVDVR